MAFSCVFQIYDINRLAQLAGMPPGSFVFGAGAGPWHVVGVNSEVSEMFHTFVLI